MELEVEKLEKEIKLFDKQIEIEKNLFINDILNGMGDVIKMELEKPPSRYNRIKFKIKQVLYNFFRMF